MNIRTALHNVVAVPTVQQAPEPALVPTAVEETETKPAAKGAEKLPVQEPTDATEAPGQTAPPATPTTEGVFVTGQSLVTFPVASFVVVVMWRVSAQVFPILRDSVAFPVVAAFLVGIFIYWISITPEMSNRDKLKAFGVAFINCFVLAASALGLEVAAAGPSPGL